MSEPQKLSEILSPLQQWLLRKAEEAKAREEAEGDKLEVDTRPPRFEDD